MRDYKWKPILSKLHPVLYSLRQSHQLLGTSQKKWSYQVNFHAFSRIYCLFFEGLDLMVCVLNLHGGGFYCFCNLATTQSFKIYSLGFITLWDIRNNEYEFAMEVRVISFESDCKCLKNEWVTEHNSTIRALTGQGISIEWRAPLTISGFGGRCGR